MSWPTEFRDKLIIGNTNSNIGIATLWSDKNKVAEQLDQTTYSVIGNFYDLYNGIEPLIRNCLSNPLLRYILVVGTDKSGSKKALVQFFKDGFTTDVGGAHIINKTDITIPKEIPSNELQNLISNVHLIDLTESIKNLDDFSEYGKVLKETINSLPTLSPYQEPKIFSKTETVINTYPSCGNLYTVRSDYIGDAWLKILHTITNYGTPSKTTNMSDVIECLNVVTVIKSENPDNPKIYPFFRFNLDDILSYYNEFCHGNIPDGTVYTYGSRLRDYDGKDQIDYMIQKLKKDKNSKSAFSTNWRNQDFDSKNPPCVISIQSLITNDNKLNLTSYIRSNDMFRGWPLNAFGLRKIQKIISNELSCEIGELTIISHSAQIYSENKKDAISIIDKYYVNTKCFFDDRGYYIIEVSEQEQQIILKHMSPKSQFLKKYEGITCREITDKLYSSVHPIDPYHISYISEELMKAEYCLYSKKKYIQDSLMKNYLSIDS